MSAPFVTTIDTKLAKKMMEDLKAQGFELLKGEHAFFTAKKSGVSCTLYLSGKLVVQGKQKEEFIHFYLEPEIFQDLRYTVVDVGARIGSDEAGKGDYFGPLCVGAVFLDESTTLMLKEWGVKDCKNLSDQQVLALGKKIVAAVPHHIVKINPLKYNELWGRLKNLNILLAIAHATAIQELVNETKCSRVIVDKFASEELLEGMLKKRGLQLDLLQRTKGEEDLAVAAGSILARMTFLEGLAKMEKEWNAPFPKGASDRVVASARTFLKTHGMEALSSVAKIHFKTTKEL